MTIKERVLEFISSKNIPVSEFERRCDLSNGYISSMRKGFGTGKLDNVLKEFTEINRDWLLYGDGEMLKNTPNREMVSDKKDDVRMSREVFDQIIRLTETVLSQQRTIETLAETNKKIAAQADGGVIYADAK